ncbi:hypothetical protein SRHO_G00337830 [Serrasalmus rhombeus]
MVLIVDASIVVHFIKIKRTLLVPQWGNFRLCIYPICEVKNHTHTLVSIHTLGGSEHTYLKRWAALSAAPGEQFGVRCLAQGHISHVLSDMGIKPAPWLLLWQFGSQELILTLWSIPYMEQFVSCL